MSELTLDRIEETIEATGYFKTRSSGVLVETKTNAVSRLHLMCPRPGGGYAYYRYERGAQTWTGPFISIGSTGNVAAVAAFPGPGLKTDVIYSQVAGKLEPVAESVPAGPGRLRHAWSGDHREAGQLEGPWVLDEADARAVAVARWHPNTPGMEMIVARHGGGIRHWWRSDAWKWSETGTQWPLSKYVGVGLVLGKGRDLFGVGVTQDGGVLHGFVRDGGNKWTMQVLRHDNHTGQPALVESSRGAVLYDLVVPHRSGQLTHYTLPNTGQADRAHVFGEKGRLYRDVGLLYNHANQLEAVACPADGGPPEHYVNRLDGNGWVDGAAFPKPNAIGKWSIAYDLGTIGIHAAVLHHGEVVTWGMEDDGQHASRGSIIDLKTGRIGRFSEPMPHVFCGGQAQLPNGDILVAGGHDGHEKGMHRLSRQGGRTTWTKLPNCRFGRWYPTVTTLHDGKMLVTAGNTRAGGGLNSANNTYEIVDPDKEMAARPVAFLEVDVGRRFCDDYDPIDMYPFVFVLPTGRVFVHSRYTTRFFAYPRQGKGAWSDPILMKVKTPRTYGFQATAVLLPMSPGPANDYPEATVVVFGGAGKASAGIDDPATDTVERMVIGAGTPSWEKLSTGLKTGRVMPDSVILPDGKVLIVNGSRKGNGQGWCSRDPVLSAEMFDPADNSITEVAPMRTPRLYHGAAVLLPDARVLVTGKCRVFNKAPYDYPEHRGEIYEPAYLHTGKSRPVIDKAPAEITTPEQLLEVEVSGVGAADIKSLLLIRPSSCTHSFNMDQRAVYLSFVLEGGKLKAKAPKTNWVVPAGYYMLFAVSKDGVPSVAKFLRVAVFP